MLCPDSDASDIPDNGSTSCRDLFSSFRYLRRFLWKFIGSDYGIFLYMLYGDRVRSDRSSGEAGAQYYIGAHCVSRCARLSVYLNLDTCRRRKLLAFVFAVAGSTYYFFLLRGRRADCSTFLNYLEAMKLGIYLGSFLLAVFFFGTYSHPHEVMWNCSITLHV